MPSNDSRTASKSNPKDSFFCKGGREEALLLLVVVVVLLLLVPELPIKLPAGALLWMVCL